MLAELLWGLNKAKFLKVPGIMYAIDGTQELLIGFKTQAGKFRDWATPYGRKKSIKRSPVLGLGLHMG